MKKKQRLQKYHLDRRAILMMGFQALGFSILGSRLFYLQAIKKKTYKNLSNTNTLRVNLIAPSRGRIFDSQGTVLATNTRTFRVHIIKDDEQEMKKHLNTIGKIITLSPEDKQKVFKRAQFRRRYMVILVKENLSWKDISKLFLYKNTLPSMRISDGENRVYTKQNIFAHTIGYVGKIAKGELKSIDDVLLELPGFEIGKVGIEKKYEELLRGVAGSQKVEINAKGIDVRTFDIVKPKAGSDIFLTMNAVLQKYTMEVLRMHKAASLIVMDIKTGAIKSMASHPSFDPNLFVQGISHSVWNTIRQNPYTPLVNRALQGQYAPGSIFKMIVALSALKAGITKDFSVYCRGYVDIFNHRFHCWYRSGHGYVDLLRSLRESCDVWYYQTSLKIGIDNIAKMAKIFGLGQTYDIGIDAQKAGLIPDKAWKKRRYNSAWLIGETVLSAIGQGYVLVTPLQLAVMTSRIASGKNVVPFICGRDEHGENRHAQHTPLNVDPNHLNLIRESMFEVVNMKGGTGFRAKTHTWKIAGKTGTAQVRNISQKERKSKSGVIRNKDLEWKYRDHALFVGYGPFEDPKYTVVCVVEHGGGGASIAAPIVKKIFEKIITLHNTHGAEL